MGRIMTKLMGPVVGLVAGIVLSSPAAAQSGGPYKIDRSSIDGGGSLASAGAEYSMSGTAGQPDADVHTGGPYELDGGFWSTEAEGSPSATATQTPGGPTATRTPTPGGQQVPSARNGWLVPLGLLCVFAHRFRRSIPRSGRDPSR